MTPVSSQHFSCCSVLNPAALRPAPAYGDRHDHLCHRSTLSTPPWHQRCSPAEARHDPFCRWVLSPWLHRASSFRACCLYFHQSSRSLSIAKHLFSTNCRTCCPALHLCACTRAISSPAQSVFTPIPDTPLGLCTTVGNFENNSASWHHLALLFEMAAMSKLF